MQRRAVMYGFALLLAAAGSAMAQGTTSTGQEAGKAHRWGRWSMDRNQDGVVARDEWRGPEEAFAKLDADGNGSLSSEELAAARKARGERAGKRGGFMSRMDRNQDGVVARDEWRGPEEAFTKLDADSSGSLSSEELQAARGAWHGRSRSRGDGGKWFESLDRNGDGQLSREEVGDERIFERMDRNKDGVVARDETGRPNRK